MMTQRGLGRTCHGRRNLLALGAAQTAVKPEFVAADCIAHCLVDCGSESASSATCRRGCGCASRELRTHLDRTPLRRTRSRRALRHQLPRRRARPMIFSTSHLSPKNAINFPLRNAAIRD